MYICIDIGGTAIKHGLSSASGTLLQQGSTPTRAHEGGGSGIVRTVRQLIRQYIETKQENETIDGIAISTAGMVDPVKGSIFYALPASIPDYTGTEWKKYWRKNSTCLVPLKTTSTARLSANSGVAQDGAHPLHS